MRLPRVIFEGAVYHVYSRGNNHAPIFQGEADRFAFLDLLREVKAEFGIKVRAWALMTNHFHLVVETPNANLSAAMKRLVQGYSRAYNTRHARSGHLFENRYKCRLVEKDRYLLALVRYLHLNPVKAGIVRSAAEYAWSSHAEYAFRKAGSIADWDEVLPLFSEDPATAGRKYSEFIDTSVGDREWSVLDRKRNGILGSAIFRANARTRKATGSSLTTSVVEDAIKAVESRKVA